MSDEQEPTGETSSPPKEEPSVKAEEKSSSAAAPSGRRRSGAELKRARLLVARLLWAVCVVCALILASAVLMIALDANPANDLVRFVVERADDVDLGFFDLDNPIKDFDRDLAAAEDTRTALFNYGIAAIVWLVVGRVLDRLVRP